MENNSGLAGLNALGDRLTQPLFDWWDALTDDKRGSYLIVWATRIIKEWESQSNQDQHGAKGSTLDLMIVGLHHMLCREQERRQKDEGER